MLARTAASRRLRRRSGWLTPCTTAGIRRASTWLASALAIAFAAGVARGDPKREVPDYDGRGNPDVEAGSWVLWIPRVALSPVYFVHEYVLRRPLGALVTHAEREHWAESVVGLFTFGTRKQHLLVPTALYDFGLLPSVGFYYAGDGVFSRGNDLRLHGATWGSSWINATAAERYALDEHDRIQARFEFKRSEDNRFAGIGPDITGDGQSRYGLERTEGSVSFRRLFGVASRFEAEAGVGRIAFVEGSCCDEPSLDERIAAGEVMAPPGYREPYNASFARLDLTLDQRRPRPEPGGGAFLHLHARPALELPVRRSWLRYGAEVGHAIDLTGHRRTLRAQLAVDMVDSLTGDPVPFTEYPDAGGDLMPGFVPGWPSGRSIAAAQIAYTWPVWLELDAQARFAIGDAFGARLDGLSPGKLRMSADFGFTTSTAHDQGFEVLIGLGSETFDQGSGIASVRVTLGSRRGF